MEERLFVSFFPQFDWELQLSIEHATMYLTIPVFISFLYSLFKKEIHVFVLRILQLTGILFTIITFLTPARIHTQLNTPYQIILIFFMLYCLYIIIISMIKKYGGALLVFIASLFLVVFATNDILFDHGIINTGFMISYGLIGFIFIQSVMIANRFSAAFTKKEQLTLELQNSKKLIEEQNEDLENQVNIRTATIQDQNLFLEDQMQKASYMQRALLPQNIPPVLNCSVSYIYEPANNVGGDYLDFFSRNDYEIGIFICDVSGHDVAGAFLVSMIKMSLNNWEKTIESPAITLENIHDSIRDKLGGLFVSACICYINTKTGAMICSNAGHPSIIRIDTSGNFTEINPKGKIITDLFAPEFEEHSVMLDPGDRVVIYTDGTIETLFERRYLQGEKIFHDNLKKILPLKPDEACKSLLNDIHGFSKAEDTQEDDITVIILDYKRED